MADSSFNSANIRGIRWRKAVLRQFDFSKAYAGLPFLCFFGHIIGLLVLGGMSGIFVSFASIWITGLLSYENIAQYSIIPGLVAAFISLVVLLCILFEGFVTAIGFGIVCLATLGVLAILTRGSSMGASLLYTSVATIQELLVLWLLALGTAITKSFSTSVFVGFLSSVFIGLGLTFFLASQPAARVQLDLLDFSIASYLIFLGVRIGRKAYITNSRFSGVARLAIHLSGLGGTSFHQADLTEAIFTRASLRHADFTEANLTRTYWYQAKGLEFARFGKTYLANPKIRELVVSCDGQGQKFDGLDLTGVNLQDANLQDASFIGASLNQSNLRGADLSRACLKQTQLDGGDLTGATLTGAVIEDWGITSTTILKNVRCDYVFMRLQTPDNQNPLRKPDNWREFFAEGEFADFIQPFFDTLDLYHSQDVDPRAISIALKELSNNHPDDDLQFVAIERRGKNGINLRFKTSPKANKSELSQEYFENYDQIKKELPISVQIRLAEQDAEIRSLKGTIEQFILTGTHQSTIQAETIQVIQGDSIVTEHRGIQINAGDNTTISGMGCDDDSANSEAMKTILVLAANPKDTSVLRLGEEVRKIQAGLERSQYRDRFKLEQRWAVTPIDVRRALLDCQPQIVHFCGHGVGTETGGTASSSSRKLTILSESAAEPEGLVFEDEMGKPQLVSGSAIADLFGLFNNQIECVVLNACYSSVQANAIMQQIPYVVGMSRWIDDQAAIQFAIGFYDAILAGQSVEFAYKLGCNAIQMANIPDHLVPKLHQKLS